MDNVDVLLGFSLILLMKFAKIAVFLKLDAFNVQVIWNAQNVMIIFI